MGIGHWALVLSVRVASRREVVGVASRREVLGIGHWALGIGYFPLLSRLPTPDSRLPTPHSPHLKRRSARREIKLQSTQRLRRRYLQCVRLICG